MLGYYNQKDYAFVIVALVQTLPEKQSEMKVPGKWSNPYTENPNVSPIV